MPEYVNATASTAILAGQLLDVAAANDANGLLSVKKYASDTATSKSPIGVAMKAAAAGAQTTIKVYGSVETLLANGTIAAGDDLMASTAGKVVTATAGSNIIGRALSTGAAAGSVTVLVQPQAGIKTVAQAAFVADAPAGGTGATGGAYDTSGHRDTMIACVNALKAIAIAKGDMAAS